MADKYREALEKIGNIVGAPITSCGCAYTMFEETELKCKLIAAIVIDALSSKENLTI